MPIILDGRALAEARRPGLARRAAAVTRRRGRRPRLLLVAFEDPDGRVPFVDQKRRICAETGVSVTPLLFSGAVEPAAALARFRAALSSHPDAVFVQLPFPSGIDGPAWVQAIPIAADIDRMSPAAVDRQERVAAAPPLTVAAALALLDHHKVSLAGLEGVVVGPATPFHDHFEWALGRRGVAMRPRIEPTNPGLKAGVADAGLVILAASEPGLVPADWIRTGAGRETSASARESTTSGPFVRCRVASVR